MTIEEACQGYLRELEARALRKGTLQGYHSLFRQLQSHCSAKGVTSLDGFDRTMLRRWRASWGWAYSTQRLRLVQLKAFFAFAEAEGWIAESPAKGLRSPRSDSPPTLPLTTHEVRALLDAAGRKPREQALLLLLRYSGLGIRDAVTLSRDAIEPPGDLVLRRAKTGELVTVSLPPTVLAALEAARPPGQKHYFWTGRSAPVTVAKYWRARLKKVAAEAGVADFRPHRLRDTFAVSLLLSGVLMQDVSTLLGHSSLATTERHYAPWCAARRKRLRRIVRDAQRADPLLAELTPRKKTARAATATPAEARLETRTTKPARQGQGST